LLGSPFLALKISCGLNRQLLAENPSYWELVSDWIRIWQHLQAQWA